MLHYQILFSLASAVSAETILIVASRYLKLVTPSNIWLFMLNICTDVVCAVGHDLAIFCADFYSICCCSV